MNLIEEIAEALHDGFLQAYQEDGWILGAERNERNKIHPHLKPYSECGLENNNFDRLMAALLIDILIQKIKLFSLIFEENDNTHPNIKLNPIYTAPLIHLAFWRATELCNRKYDDHTHNFRQPQSLYDKEHIIQAKKIIELCDKYIDSIIFLRS